MASAAAVCPRWSVQVSSVSRMQKRGLPAGVERHRLGGSDCRCSSRSSRSVSSATSRRSSAFSPTRPQAPATRAGSRRFHASRNRAIVPPLVRLERRGGWSASTRSVSASTRSRRPEITRGYVSTRRRHRRESISLRLILRPSAAARPASASSCGSARPSSADPCSSCTRAGACTSRPPP